MRISELKKEAYEFKRDIVLGGEDARSKVRLRAGALLFVELQGSDTATVCLSAQKIVAERIIRYYEEKLRSKETLIEKLKLKNTSLKVRLARLAPEHGHQNLLAHAQNHIQKTDAELRQKEEQGESLHSIDFHQLKIENSQFNQKIREKNAEVRLPLSQTVARLACFAYARRVARSCCG
jgi:hypothetical protein